MQKNILILFLLVAFLTINNTAIAQTTVTKTIATDFTVDGNSQSITPFTYATPTDFPANYLVTDVDVQVQFDKRNSTTCGGADGLGNPFNTEIAYSITSPDSTTVALVSAGTYSSNTNPPSVTVTFDDAAASSLGTLPTTGTFKPVGSLASFNGRSPIGAWTITAQDTSTGKVLCHTDASITITANIGPVVTISASPTTISESGNSSTITATLNSTSAQNVTVNLALSGTATGSGTDYNLSSSSIVITAGLLTGTTTLTSVDDSLLESNETAIVDVSSVVNATESGTQQQTITITDNDTATASLTTTTNGSETGPTNIVYTVTLSKTNNTGSAINFDINPSGGTATTGADYTDFSSTTVSVANGSSTGTKTVIVANDTLNEPTETVSATISNSSNASVSIATDTASANITDNDPAPTVSLGVDNANINENGGVATYTATLNTASGQDVTVNLGLTGTASGADYTASDTSIIITAGNTTGSITISSIDDALDEADETVIIDITSVVNGTENGSQQATTTITDDDAAPTVSIGVDSANILENGGVATFTATLNIASGQDVTVNLGLTGTASGADYTASDTNIIIAAGDTTGNVTVTGVDDALDEADETVIVDITSVTNGTEDGTQQATTTINDDDDAPTVSIGVDSANILENGEVATFTATLNTASGQDVTVNLGLTGTASGADYTASDTNIIIAAGDTTGNVTVTGVDDALDEADETVIVDITSITNGTEDGTQQATTTITDDDATPTVAIDVDNTTIAENGGVATITATLSAAAGRDVTVDLALTGTASGSDYTASSLSIVIAEGDTTASATITGVDDTIDEVDETVIADVSSVTNGTEDGTQQVTITITSDDAPPTVSLGVNNTNIAENNGVATFTATLSSASSHDVTVNLGLTGTASGSDYTASSTSITINAGDTTGTITVTATNDALDEPNETVIADITSVTNGTELGTQTATTSITDDDATPTVTIAVNNATIAENGGVATFTATLSAVSGQNVTVNLARTGTASGADYTASASTITINAGLTTGNITVIGVDDALDEPNETVIVDITTVLNATESGTQTASTSIIDDDVTTDTDGDGLSDADEQTYGTDINLPDTDNDGVQDGQEVTDGSAPLDRGSNIPVLPTTICSLWNGFLQNPGLAMWNIMEHVNLSNAPIQVSTTLYSISGVAQSTTQFTIAAGAQQDILVHGMAGWTLNSYGQVCSTVISGNPGDLDGRMTYYKPTNTGGYEFAFALPFSDGIKGSQFVPFNTFEPSLDPTDSANFVSNWIQVTNQESTSQSGTIYFYQQDGALIGQTAVNLAAKARQDFPAHQFGSSIVGLVEFRPSNNTAKFGMQNVRYYHDSASFVNRFDGAFELDGTVGNGQGITVPLDTIGSTSVLEVANTKGTTLPVRVRVYDLSGTQKMNLSFNLAAHASVHLIMDSVLVGQKGVAYVSVTGNVVDSVIATAMQYGYTASNGIQTLYGIPAKQALGATLRGTYNTFINQNCSLFLTNPTSTIQNANIRMVRLDGTVVVAGQSVSVPANGGMIYDACSQDVDNTYGVITTTPSNTNSIYSTVIRQGNLDDYRFPTLSRQ